MNAWNEKILQEDDSGLIESCDECNALISNWEWPENAFLTFGGKIVCKK